MRADRLLSILLLLQAHGRLTGRQLAERLEVSARTLHRDMEALSAAGVPVYALRGARGGWRLDEGWRTQVPGLDETELRALLMSQPRMVGDSPLARAAERALVKLTAALPVALRAEAASMRQRLHVDTTSWYGAVEDLSLLPTVQDAVARDRKLTLRYWRANRERVERTVDPLGLVAKGSAWYLVARSGTAFRTYRVSRIEDARILDEGFERPADFDLAVHWTTSAARFEEGLPRYDAVLRVEPRTAAWVRRWRGSTAEELPARDASGWVHLRLRFDFEDEACFVALGLGPRAEVLQPARLRARVHAEAAAVAERRD